MPDILQLKDFAITRLHVDWHNPADSATAQAEIEGTSAFDYEVLRRTDTPRSFALKLRYKLRSKAGKPEMGYSIESEIVGFFDFPETMDEQEMQTLIRINGGTILYGILRGEIAAFTGSFPGGKFVLPAVLMQDIVANIEKRIKGARVKKTADTKAPAKTRKRKV